MRSIPGGFLGGSNILRSLTLSPLNSALQQAHQMARRHLEAGGATTPPPKHPKPDTAPADFIVPRDINADEVAQAVEAKLREQGGPSDEPVLQRRAGGRVVIPAAHLVRLGDGHFEKGRRFVQGIVNQIRVRRARQPRRPS